MTTVLYDVAIPFINESFKQHARCIPYQAGSLGADLLAQADILLVRSVTPVTRDRLQASCVRCVGSVTAGVDHLDIKTLDELGIAWCHAPGANAMAVAQYVASVLVYLSVNSLIHGPRVLGLIGCGQVGSRVRFLASQLGWEVCVYDPPKAARDPRFESAAWEELLGCSVLCCCVPLTQEGAWPTEHMIHASVLKQLPKDAVIMNVGRGGVFDEKALLAQNQIRWCCDVWEGEPTIREEMVRRALLATPHIAGYTHEAKHGLTWQVYEAIAREMGWVCEPFASLSVGAANPLGVQAVDEATLLKYYNPVADDRSMREALESSHDVASVFRQLRSDYLYRREWELI